MKSKAKPYWRTWPRAPRIPTARLLAWINHLGTATVARSLVCSEMTVRNWKRGRPLSPERAVQLICNSHRQPLPDGTPLTYEDCFGPVAEERSEFRGQMNAQKGAIEKEGESSPSKSPVAPFRKGNPISPRRRRNDRAVPKPKTKRAA